jgi:E3 Ubiquitin ligase
VILFALILRTSDPTGLVVWCGVGFCAGIGLFFYGFQLLQRRRLILDTPFSKIRSASMGMVEVSGLAAGPYTMIAPITARPCYYYRTLVWEYKHRGKNKEWVKVAGECMHVPFFVDDNSGRLLVDPRGADLDLHRDFEQQFCDSFFTTKDPAPENVRSFLARHGIATSNKIKVEEYCIKPKNSLFILGTLSENPGLEVGPHPVQDNETVNPLSMGALSQSLGAISFSLRAGAQDLTQQDLAQRDLSFDSSSHGLAIQSEVPSHPVIRLSPVTSVPAKTSEMTQQQKVAAALLKAGISNPAAWTAAGLPATAGVQVITDPAPATTSSSNSETSPETQTITFDPRPPVVLMKGINNKTFLISWRSQREVARSLGWKCALMIWGGPALSLLCLYLILSIERL